MKEKEKLPAGEDGQLRWKMKATRAENGPARFTGFFRENWRTIVAAVVTTLLMRLLLGW